MKHVLCICDLTYPDSGSIIGIGTLNGEKLSEVNLANGGMKWDVPASHFVILCEISEEESRHPVRKVFLSHAGDIARKTAGDEECAEALAEATLPV